MFDKLLSILQFALLMALLAGVVVMSYSSIVFAIAFDKLVEGL